MMATTQEVAQVIAQADREFNHKWMTGLQWEQGKGQYHVESNAAWQAERGGNDIWLTPEDIAQPRDQYRRQKVQEAFGDVDTDTYEQALTQ